MRLALARSGIVELAARRIAVMFFLQAMIAVLLLAVLVPPFENSDEIAHLQRADQISRGGVLGVRFDDGRKSGGSVAAGISRADSFIGAIRFHADRKVDSEMLRAARSVHWGERNQVDFANTAIYPPFAYLPAVIGIWIGKLGGTSIASTLTLCRMLSGLACVLISTVAVALAGEIALFLAVVLSLPMALSLLAAVSQDGLMLAVAALCVALVRQIRDMPPRSDALDKRLLWLVASLSLLGMCRPAYASFAVIPVLLTGYRKRIRFAAGASIVACIGLWSLCATTVMAHGTVDRGAQPGAQLLGLLLHPSRIVTVMVHTMTGRQGMEGQSFFHEMVGVLGWIDVILPRWYYPFAGMVMLLAGSCACIRSQVLLVGWRSGVAFVAALGAVGLVFLLEYMTWTPLGYPFVDGVQGRYFLPIVLMLPFMLPSFGKLPGRLRASTSAVFLAFSSLSVTVTIMSIVNRYYIG